MKRALVISGGGSKGAFAVGVVKKLLATWPGLEFDILVGTSTGSLITPFVALDELPLVEELYTTQTTDKILTTYNLGDRLMSHSIFGSNPCGNCLQDTCRKIKHNSYSIILPISHLLPFACKPGNWRYLPTATSLLLPGIMRTAVYAVPCIYKKR